MANKAISELPQAQNVNNQDLFVLEQGGLAKKLPAETFITEQGIINALAEALDGHGGIQSVTLASVSGRIRTYRITFSDGSATTFQVYDGTSIERITRTSSSGLQDTYTIFMSDGTTTFFTVTNGADGTVSEAMLNDALKDKAPAITETTESSAIANFTDGADDMVMHNIVAEINPVQSGSGDPSPDNIRPITGWTGVNVTRTGKNIAEFTHGKGVDTSGHIHNIANRSATVTPIKIDNTRQYKYVNSNGNAGIYAVWNGDTLVRRIAGFNSGAVMDTSGGDSLYVCGYSGDADVLPETCGVFFADQYEEFEPYQGNTVTVDWQTEAGTVYGGTIDVATGLLTVTHAMATFDKNTTDWSWQDSNKQAYLGSALSSAPAKYNSTEITHICNILRPCSNGSRPNYIGNFSSLVFNGSGVAFSAPNCNSPQDFTDWLTNDNITIQFCYKLATPQTYQLTPQEVKTLLGTNNVWADTGNVSVTYPADTKMYIEKLTMPTEDDLVANQAITSGKYFMIGNSLYLALANIASGAQITIDTNAQRVSLADALNTINS